jgi:hypothetical protein
MSRGIFLVFFSLLEEEDCTKFFQAYLWRKLKHFELLPFLKKNNVICRLVYISPQGFMFFKYVHSMCVFSMFILLMSHEF